MTSNIVRWPRHIRARCDTEHNDGGWGCPICAGGLFVCTTCGAAEGELPTDCPGYKLHHAELKAIYNEHLDYVAGAWVCVSEAAKRPVK